jgi:hypothetical protein
MCNIISLVCYVLFCLFGTVHTVHSNYTVNKLFSLLCLLYVFGPDLYSGKRESVDETSDYVMKEHIIQHALCNVASINLHSVPILCHKFYFTPYSLYSN